MCEDKEKLTNMRDIELVKLKKSLDDESLKVVEGLVILTLRDIPCRVLELRGFGGPPNCNSHLILHIDSIAVKPIVPFSSMLASDFKLVSQRGIGGIR